METPSATTTPPTLAELAAEHGGAVVGDGSLAIAGVAAPDDAGPSHLCPLFHPRWVDDCVRSRAGAVLATRSLARRVKDRPVWAHDAARDVLAALLDRFSPEPPVVAGRHDAAVVGGGAAVDATARVEALAVVEDGARVGAGTVVGARAFVGHDVQVGRDCRIGPGAVLIGPATIGDRVRIGPGSVIGSDGFGFVPGGDVPRRVPQRGRVVVEDDVDLGACTVVDRGTLGVTRLGRGVKIDNLVQVGHNVVVEAGAVIAAQTGLAGSVRVGARSLLGGQVGIADHLDVGPDARLAAKSGVVSDVAPGATVAGYPAIAHHTWLRIWGTLLRAASRRDGSDQ